MLELPCQLAYGGGLTYSIDAYHQYDIWLVVAGQVPVVIVFRVVLSQQGCNLLLEYLVQFRGTHILVASHALLYALDDLQRGVYSHVTCDKYFLQIVQHVFIYLRLAGNGTRQFVEHAGLGFLQSLV